METKDFIRLAKLKKNKILSVYELFINLEDSFTLKKIIPNKNKRIKFLKEQKIKFDSKEKWPNVLNPKYISFPYNYVHTDVKELYLDILHELTHCFQRKVENINFKKQIMQFEYYENPKELEAYRLGWIQAKKIGMTKKEFTNYLIGNNFLNKNEKKLLIKNVFKYSRTK